jgi:hypothetical protein
VRKGGVKIVAARAKKASNVRARRFGNRTSGISSEAVDEVHTRTVIEMIEMPHRPRELGSTAEYTGIAFGVLGSIALSLALVPFRDNTASANMALALVVPVLVAAVIGGRWAGGIGAVAATLCFDFFFTRPYLSLRIESQSEVETFVILFVVAMITAEVGLRARRGGVAARQSRDELDRVYRIANFSAHGASVNDVVAAVRSELIGLFDLEDCDFEPVPSSAVFPRLGARGAFEGAELVVRGADFEMPTGGIELPVVGRGRDYGRLLLFAAPATPAPIQKRMVAVAIADELGMTLASQSSESRS